jgi:hypothetical protein
MKTRKKVLLFGVILFMAMVVQVFGQEALLFQHSGANNPTSEGFTGPNPSTSIGPVTGDLGMNAWKTAVSNNVIIYNYSLTSQQLSELTGSDCIMSLTLRVTQSDLFGNTYASFVVNSEAFQLRFGAETNGDPIVFFGSSLAPLLVLNGTGSTYNNYQLRYGAATDTASLWVNGIEQISSINGPTGYGPGGGVFWGESQAGPSGANWNLVSLSVPEPSSMALILLGGGVLAWCYRKS